MNKTHSRAAQKEKSLGGGHAQQVVRLRLLFLGLVEVDPIETGWHIQRAPGGRVVRATPKAQVAGDFRAMLPNGRSVLVECKRRKSERLTWSTIEPHQRDKLNQHALHRGLPLLAWVHNGEAVILEWPVPGLMEGGGVSWDEVQPLALTRQRVAALYGGELA